MVGKLRTAWSHIASGSHNRNFNDCKCLKLAKLYADADFNDFGISVLRASLENSSDKEPDSNFYSPVSVSVYASGNDDFRRTAGKSGTETAVSCIRNRQDARRRKPCQRSVYEEK